MTDHSTKDDHERGRQHRLPPLIVDRPEQLQALGDPTRWKILGRLLVEPASIQELARALGAKKGTIGHHVRILDRAGLIRVVEERRVRGVTERRYARVAGQFQLPPAEGPMAGELSGLGLLPLRQALAEARPISGADDPSMSFVMRARMPAARARRFAVLLEQLAAEFVDGAPGEGETFGFAATIYVPDWAEPRSS